MVRYRRNRVEGGCYFFTVTLRDRRSDLLIRHVDLLSEAFSACHAKHPFSTDAIVILPEHLHTIWTLPEGDSNYPERWKSIKARFTCLLRKGGLVQASPWQPRYWEHTIRDDLDWQRHMDYIHYNPVKHGYAGHPRDWRHSSFHRCVAEGYYDWDWGTQVSLDVLEMNLE